MDGTRPLLYYHMGVSTSVSKSVFVASLREFEIYGRAKTLRVASDILQKVGFASRKLDGSRE